MPTRYTADVKDGKVATLPAFAMVCARQFDALIMMRDDPMDAAIPESFEPQTQHHDDAIATARKTLDELATLTVEERDARKVVERARYMAMRHKVENWRVPAEIASLREFMLDQIDESIRFDCPETNAFHDRMTPKRKTGADWLREQLDAASTSLAYHTKARAEEVERVKGRNAWLAALRGALKEGDRS